MFLVPIKNNGRLSTFGPEIERFFSGTAAQDFSPAVDIKEEAESYVIAVDVPGIDPKDVDIAVEGGFLSVRGERSREIRSEDNAGYTKVERSFGRFERSFRLPETADIERISANGKHGVLTITVPKKESVKPRKITVQ